MPIIESLVLASMDDSPRSKHTAHSAPSLYEDAKSEGMDDIVNEITESILRPSVSHLSLEDETPRAKDGKTTSKNSGEQTGKELKSWDAFTPPLDMETSMKIRKKYGLDAIGYSPSLLSVTAPSVKSESQRGSVVAVNGRAKQRDPSVESNALLNVTGNIVSQLQNEIINESNVAFDESHELMLPFFAIIEVALQHGWRGMETGVFNRPFSLWDFIKRIERLSSMTESRLNIVNVRNFTQLKKSGARVRVWIRLALMSKRLVPDLSILLNQDCRLIERCYESWAFIRSDLFLPFLSTITSTDSIDFNFCIKEEDIPKNDFICKSWNKLFEGGEFHFDYLIPPLSPIRRESRMIFGGNESELLNQLNVLNEENQKIRHALTMQINQRAYFQDEFSKSQAKCANLLFKNQQLVEEVNVLQKSNSDLKHQVEAHEATNIALQRQLTEAFTRSDSTVEENGLVARLHRSINSLREELDKQKILNKSLQDEMKSLEMAHKSTIEQHNQQLFELENRREQIEANWSERLYALQNQLKISNSLKEEYKRMLSKANGHT